MAPPAQRDDGVSTGIAGLDDILCGGFRRGRIHLIEGRPGAGKTTLALQFLLEGARAGEPCLYITLSETIEELRAAAATHGWSLDGLALVELVPAEATLDPDKQQSLLYASDLELGETIQRISDEVARVNPARIVLDSLSEIRLLAQNPLTYRRQILALKHYFGTRKATVLLLDDLTSAPGDLHLHSIVHGVLTLEQLAPLFGAERRRLHVPKFRGVKYRGGYHDFAIETAGLAVFPRLVAAEHRRSFKREVVASGIAGLDALLGGGLHRGTTTLVMGPSGAGKSLLAMQYVAAALERGEAVAVFLFDEELSVFLDRTAGMGLDLQPHLDVGRLAIETVDPAELSPGELTAHVRRRVEGGVRMVVIDSLNGYQVAMPEEQFLLLHLHELLTYLNRQGVLTLMVMAQHGLLAEMKTPADLTYLSDSIVVLRYFEAGGRVRRAISVMKKRTGGHEDTIREFRLTGSGLRIGRPLDAFQGVLAGVPTYTGRAAPLFGGEDE